MAVEIIMIIIFAKKMDKFNSFYEWHDSLVLFVAFDRHPERNQDSVCFGIEWYSGKKEKLYFDNVYYIDFTSHFIHGSDSILNAKCELLCDSEYWSIIPDYYELNSLIHYCLETNSTGGKYHVIAKGYHFEPYD